MGGLLLDSKNRLVQDAATLQGDRLARVRRARAALSPRDPRGRRGRDPVPQPPVRRPRAVARGRRDDEAVRRRGARDRHRGEGPRRGRARARRVVPRARAARTLTDGDARRRRGRGRRHRGPRDRAEAPRARIPTLSVLVLEKEKEVAAHQTGHNSGVIHSGLYYKPGSEKAKTCVEGRRLLVDFCRKHGVPHERCGKLVVATSERELPALDELERARRANGLAGVRALAPAEFRKIEPHAAGIARAPRPGDGHRRLPRGVRGRSRELIACAGGSVRTSTRVTTLSSTDAAVRLVAGRGRNRGGPRRQLRRPPVRPRRAARRRATRASRSSRSAASTTDSCPRAPDSCKHLIYPVPDPRFPFLGVHFTRRIERRRRGRAERGAGARARGLQQDVVRRAGRVGVRSRIRASGAWPCGTWAWASGRSHRSFSKRAFVKALQRLVPDLREEDLEDGRIAGSGRRRCALTGASRTTSGSSTHGRVVHVLNAPSPAATASLAIGERIAARVLAMRRAEGGRGILDSSWRAATSRPRSTTSTTGPTSGISTRRSSRTRSPATSASRARTSAS